MTQPKAVLCHFHFVLAIFSILFGILLSPSALYAVPMQTKSHHDIQPGYRYHIVQHGDTLYNIAQRYGTTIDAIRQANGLHDSYIQIGQRLAIPGSQPVHPLPKPCYIHHTVQMGETLFSIARAYNISVQVLLQANPISDPNNIKAGQQLCIPKFEQGQPDITHTPEPCSATSCCQTDCTPAPTPTEIPCAPTSCCQTDCAPMPTPMLTATPVPTEAPCVPSCCQTSCCQADCPPTWTPPTSTPAPPTSTPTSTPTLTSTATEIPSCATSCCQTSCCQTSCPPTEATVAPTPTPYNPQQGIWHGEYFDGNGVSRAVRHDPEIDFNWGTGGPNIMTGVVDNFQVHWTRTEYFDAGTYRFHTTIDDGIIVWMDDKIVLDSWYTRPVPHQDVELEAGLHYIQVQYYEHTGDARVSLNWTRE